LWNKDIMDRIAEELERLKKEAGLDRCLECGKCTSSCPMGEIYEEFTHAISPRGIVQKARTDDNILFSASIWQCLECEECTKACVSGIEYRRFMRGMRDLARRCGVVAPGVTCRRCGKTFLPGQAMRFLMSKVKGIEEARRFLLLCPACRQRVYARTHKFK
jgi:heterodisulfide reductase subunit C